MADTDAKIIVIAAMSEDGIIGKGDGMPWQIEEEYRQYLNYIRGQTVIMGRRSFEIFGSDLTSENNFVVSRSMEDGRDVEVYRDFDSALSKARELNNKVFIAGGASIYKLGIKVAEAMYLSVIRGDYQGDTYFPDYDRSRWSLHRSLVFPRYQFNDYRMKDV